MLEVKAENETSRFQLFNRVAVVITIIAIITISVITKIVIILFCVIAEIHDIVFKAKVEPLAEVDTYLMAHHEINVLAPIVIISSEVE